MNHSILYCGLTLIKLELRENKEEDILFPGFKKVCIPNFTHLNYKYISALCLDVFKYIMVSTQTSTNISLLLLKKTKTFLQTTLKRDL